MHVFLNFKGEDCGFTPGCDSGISSLDQPMVLSKEVVVAYMASLDVRHDSVDLWLLQLLLRFILQQLLQ